MLKKINWPTAVVAISGIVAIASVALFGRKLGMPEDMHTGFLAFLGSFEAMVLAFMGRAFLPSKSKEEPEE